jgi:cell division protein FtsW (lipid II flippase)
MFMAMQTIFWLGPMFLVISLETKSSKKTKYWCFFIFLFLLLSTPFMFSTWNQIFTWEKIPFKYPQPNEFGGHLKCYIESFYNCFFLKLLKHTFFTWTFEYWNYANLNLKLLSWPEA